jgi:hypothetical protein
MQQQRYIINSLSGVDKIKVHGPSLPHCPYLVQI